MLLPSGKSSVLIGELTKLMGEAKRRAKLDPTFGTMPRDIKLLNSLMTEIFSPKFYPERDRILAALTKAKDKSDMCYKAGLSLAAISFPPPSDEAPIVRKVELLTVSKALTTMERLEGAESLQIALDCIPQQLRPSIEAVVKNCQATHP